MNREKLIDEAALNLFRQEFIIPGPEREKAWLNLGIHYVAKIEAALTALEAAGVKLVYPGEARHDWRCLRANRITL